MKILTVVGARPQFIKASVVSAALAAHDVDEHLVHTGQHFDENMSAIFFDELGINPPAVNLEVHESTHATMTAAMLEGAEAQIVATEPDAVLVYGDTNSTLAGALAAAKLHVPVAHVEAGLRSFNRRMPEEINRVVADHLSDLLFAPTATAVTNLAAEGIGANRVAEVGDVMYDVALRFGGIAEARADRAVNRLALAGTAYVLATVHRAENTDDPARLAAVIDGLEQVAATHPVVLPLHPRTRDRLPSGVGGSLRIIEPVGYLDMVEMERSAAVICTDSGGVQKEAYFHRVPCVTVRDETEWTELVDLGWNRVVPPISGDAVANAIRAALAAGPGAESSPYGAGDAAERIVGCLLQRYGG